MMSTKRGITRNIADNLLSDVRITIFPAIFAVICSSGKLYE